MQTYSYAHAATNEQERFTILKYMSPRPNKKVTGLENAQKHTTLLLYFPLTYDTIKI